MQMTRGSLKPDLQVTIGDDSDTADFSTLTVADIRIVAEQNGLTVVDGPITLLDVSTDGHEATVSRAWQDGETDLQGRMWISVVVAWESGKEQWFPADGPLRLDINRAPGDA